MIVTVTSIRLKSVWLFFRLSYHGLQITRQLKKQDGFIKLKNTGFGYLHYTLSVWQHEDDLKKFYREGAHLNAMRMGPAIATEIRTFTYQTEKLPTWKEAKKMLLERGKVTAWG